MSDAIEILVDLPDDIKFSAGVLSMMEYYVFRHLDHALVTISRIQVYVSQVYINQSHSRYHPAQQMCLSFWEVEMRE